MRGGKVQWVNESIGNAISQNHLYFKERIEPYMAVVLYIVFYYAKGHVSGLCHEKGSLTRENLEQDMCCLNHVQPKPIILHYFQDLKKLMAAKRWWDSHLLYHDLRQLEYGQI